MENKINIAELLKDCPSGMELDCTLFEGLEFDGIVDNEYLPIRCRVKNPNGGYNVYNFTKYGCWFDTTFAKCVIFPKGKTTWEGFQRPFKDGDILATDLGSVFYLNTRLNTDEYYGCYVGIGGDGSFHICEPFAYKECCGFATEEEKQKLFQAIKNNGYQWNAETKTLEKLVKPKFKVGDRIRNNRVDLGNIYTIIEVRESSYVVNKNNEHNNYNIDFVLQDEWELVQNKFDITTLKPFDKVLVRCSSLEKWHIQFFEKYNTESSTKFPFICLCYNKYSQCIPYENNQHLLDTANDCNDFYKTW